MLVFIRKLMFPTTTLFYQKLKRNLFPKDLTFSRSRPSSIVYQKNKKHFDQILSSHFSWNSSVDSTCNNNITTTQHQLALFNRRKLEVSIPNSNNKIYHIQTFIVYKIIVFNHVKMRRRMDMLDYKNMRFNVVNTTIPSRSSCQVLHKFFMWFLPGLLLIYCVYCINDSVFYVNTVKQTILSDQFLLELMYLYWNNLFQLKVFDGEYISRLTRIPFLLICGSLHWEMCYEIFKFSKIKLK